MRMIVKIAPLVGVVGLAMAARCEAQLFGARTVGRPLARQTVPSSADAGTMQGNERYLRGNRRSSDFVGVDAQDRARFVGQVAAQSQLASGNPAISTSPRTNTASQVNRPLKSRSANSLGEPILELGFELGPENMHQRAAQVQTRLTQTLSAHFGTQIEVSVEGRTAIVRGAIADVKDSRLVEAMVLLEPGISTVRNELSIAAAPAPPVQPTSAGTAGQRP